MSVHERSPFGWDYCDAGRRAFFGGRWPDLPCMQHGRHVIGAPGPVPAIKLCDKHFIEVYDAGLVTEPNIGEESFRRRYGGPDDPLT